MESKETREDIYFEALVRGEISQTQYENALAGKEFVVGARVEVISNVRETKGQLGTICDMKYAIDNSYGVRMDNNGFGGHNCDGKCEQGHGWYYRKQQLELI